MLYSRSEIVQIIRKQPIDLQNLLISMIWFFSRAQSSLITNNRYGLLQIDLNQAKTAGFEGHANELLNPQLNISLGSKLIQSLGLVQFAGRELSHQLPQVIQLAEFLDSQAKAIPESLL